MIAVASLREVEVLGGLSDMAGVWFAGGDVDPVDMVVEDSDDMLWRTGCSSGGRIGKLVRFRGLPVNTFVPIVHHVIIQFIQCQTCST